MPQSAYARNNGYTSLSSLFTVDHRKIAIGLLLVVLFLGFSSCKSDDYTTTPVDIDTDGDGIFDEQEILNGTNRNNPCDPKQNSGYTGFNANNSTWLAADCDTDGITNAQELSDQTDPFVDEAKDTDGDGVPDFQEVANGTDKENPCDPAQDENYEGYNASSTAWSNSDCDADGITNGDEVVNSTNPYLDDTVYAVAQFLPKLSELNLFKGNPSDLITNSTTHEYSLSTPLYSDYALKFRTISLPEGAQMTYSDDGLLQFPDGTVISKTFYYLNDERDPSLGKKLIETRLLIKTNASWNMGNYLWNETQTDAVFSNSAPSVDVDWIDANGRNRTVNYKVPFAINCTQCHNVNDAPKPIGPKARNLNFSYNGQNQIQYFVDRELLTGAPDISQIERLPDWMDSSFTLEERTRAYMDVNCAHCHQPGGLRSSNVPDRPDLRYETTFEDSKIFDYRLDIRSRVETSPGFGPSMPLVGVTQLHSEGVDLIHEYIDSLQ